MVVNVKFINITKKFRLNLSKLLFSRTMSFQMKEIDGSVLEGGGQILRISMSLSAICGIPVKITKIRLGRSKPGLAAQHLTGLELVRDMCHGKLRGAALGSTEIEFVPGKIRGGEYAADPKTAGSISLLLQVALPCALFADGRVTLQLRGGTNADMAPHVDFMSEVFRPNLEKFGRGTFDLELHKRGYYPKGGGHVTINVNPVESLKSVTVVTPGVVKSVHGWSYVAGKLPIRMAHQMAEGAKKVLERIPNNITKADIECYKEQTDIVPYNASGSGIILVCETTTGCILGGSALGKRDAEPFSVGTAAAQEIVSAFSMGSCFDEHTQDQIIIFMALAQGTSTIRVGKLTMHAKTAMYIVESLIQIKFDVKEENDSVVVSCKGIGFVNKF